MSFLKILTSIFLIIGVSGSVFADESNRSYHVPPPADCLFYDLNSDTNVEMDSFASPKSILEFSFRKRGLSIPAKPEAIDLFKINTVFALSTSMTGIP